MCRKKVSRRNFLKYLTYGTCGAAIHKGFLPGFSSQVLAAPTQRAAVNDALLYVINLGGGATYNMYPIYHSAWRDKNPIISLSEAESLPFNAEQGFHPSLSYFKQLFDDGDLALINEVGFPNDIFSRSHSTAAQMWMKASGNPMGAVTAGWMNTLSCQMSGFYAAVSLAGSDPIVQGGCPGTRALESLSSLNGSSFLYSTDETTWLNMQRTAFNNGTSASSASSQAAVSTSISNMEAAAEAIQDATQADPPNVGVNPPNNDYRDAAKLTMANNVLGTQAFYLEHGGFDTHSNQRNSLPGNLANVNQGVRYLAEVNKALGLWDRTIILVTSEFARTFENSSQGDDHGHIHPMAIMGGRVNGRQVTAAPTNQKIASTSGSYLTSPAVDTRNVIAQVIAAMGYSAAPVIQDSGYDTTNLSLFL